LNGKEAPAGTKPTTPSRSAKNTGTGFEVNHMRLKEMLQTEGAAALHADMARMDKKGRIS
jgi:hypothetical protein